MGIASVGRALRRPPPKSVFIVFSRRAAECAPHLGVKYSGRAQISNLKS